MSEEIKKGLLGIVIISDNGYWGSYYECSNS